MGLLNQITGIPIIEDKHTREGTYICIDKDGMPIPQKDIANSDIAKIIVHSIESFEIAVKNNENIICN